MSEGGGFFGQPPQRSRQADIVSDDQGRMKRLTFTVTLDLEYKDVWER